MRFIKALLLLFLISSCQKSTKKHVAIGAWNRCNKDGSYWEYKITDNYMLMLTTKSDDVWLFRNKFVDTTMVLSEFENGPSLIINNDTLVPIVKSKNNFVFKKHLHLGQYHSK